ncbi:molybdate ABC transporter substrate-binding protein, partial [Micromonospora zhanjiangensis]
GGSDAGTGGGDRAGGGTGAVTVLAAASLKEAFTAIGTDFEAGHPGSTVTFSFGGSSALAAQINQGVPADVFASASPTNVRTVTGAANGTGEPRTFARNQLVIAVPKGNPGTVTKLADLARPGVKVALCAEQVPCGAAARKVLTAAHVDVTPVTLEQDVKAALAKVKLGEVDAALVYRTDARSAASDVDGVEFTESAGAINDYPILLLRGAPNRAGGQAFVDYVLSEPARAALDRYGFQAPTG